jgi:large subunit ribosomal protein L18e
MSARTSNPQLIELIKFLTWKANEHQAPIWSSVAQKLKKTKHNRVAVNLSRINRYTSERDVALVPGKILSSGSLTHIVSIAAVSSSLKARKKIEQAGGKYLTIEALVHENPKGSGVKIIG